MSTISSTPRKIKIKMGDILFFLHIPKTAGTSFYYTLLKQVYPKNSFIVDDDKIKDILDSYFPDDFSNYKFFRQHADYYFYRYLPRKPLYLTFETPITAVLHSFQVLKDNTLPSESIAL